MHTEPFTFAAYMGVHDDMGKWLLFLAVAGSWIAIQAGLLAYCKSHMKQKAN